MQRYTWVCFFVPPRTGSPPGQRVLLRSASPAAFATPRIHKLLQHLQHTSFCNTCNTQAFATPATHKLLQHMQHTSFCNTCNTQAFATPRSHMLLHQLQNTRFCDICQQRKLSPHQQPFQLLKHLQHTRFCNSMLTEQAFTASTTSQDF